MNTLDLTAIAKQIAPSCHAFWKETRAAQDIHWGPVYSDTEHPCMKLWEELTEPQRAEDALFIESTLRLLQEAGFEIVKSGTRVRLSTLLMLTEMAVSLSESRRIVAMGAVQFNGKLIKDIGQKVTVNPGDLIEVGKKKKVTITSEMLENL